MKEATYQIQNIGYSTIYTEEDLLQLWEEEEVEGDVPENIEELIERLWNLGLIEVNYSETDTIKK